MAFEDSTPNVPPSPAEAFNEGFFIGRNGNDVDIIGVLGPDGERPKINGGTIVFRVGVFPDMGVYGLPVSFTIENLELFNPDIAYPNALYSRVALILDKST